MQNQTNNRKRKDIFNMTSLSVGNKKKTKVEIDHSCNWYPVWIIGKDWACKKIETLEKEIDCINSHYGVSRIGSSNEDSGFWILGGSQLYDSWSIYNQELEYLEDLLDYMHSVDPHLGPPSTHVVVQNVTNTVSE